MSKYPFHFIRHERETMAESKEMLASRPFVNMDTSFQADARHFIPGEQLETALNTAIAAGEPLLITGEPGTGKTQTAYYAAYKLGLEPVIHFQVKSDSTAKEILYHFDTVRYFHDAHLDATRRDPDGNATLPDKGKYVEPRALWQAFESARKNSVPSVLLIDEIDKAPRDFPNDLLHELDKMEFTVAETGERVSAPHKLRPLVFITSNSERRLPEPFLRRCVYHHIRFDSRIVERAVASRNGEFQGLDKGFVKMALRRFLALRQRSLRKQPATGELLVWLRVLALATGTYPKKLGEDLSELPYIGVLLKDHQDIEELGGSGDFQK